ncbi:MAG: hypothetical protein OXI55_14640 [Gammaproteobacteria bacterium]|nr:hypothetical protein [Gammaproteobacteria bacterium]
MAFRDREKQRLAPLKQLFGEMAQQPGMYRGSRREFCLHEDCSAENLEGGIRSEALAYFNDRAIGWHDGRGSSPSNHLCCSQSSCVNFWFPFVRAPQALARVLKDLGYDVVEMLPITSDCPLTDGTHPFVSFEWIGERNYLGELGAGVVAPDESRTRGAHFTSLDFCCRFRRSDGRVQLLAGEWKYTEHYSKGENLRYSKANTDRLDRVYRQHLERPDCQISADVPWESLFFDPFDQLMRQQLLCTAMERHREMDAEVVTLLHIAPRANREFIGRVTSPALESLESDIHDIWAKLVRPGCFNGVATEDLLMLVSSNAPKATTRDYLQVRYGGMA